MTTGPTCPAGEAGGPYDGALSLGARARGAMDSLPPTSLILLGIVSVQVGAGLAKDLFSAMPPTTVVLMRLLVSAVVLPIATRPRLRGRSWRDLAVAGMFGVTLAGMNFCFYQAMDRIPLGVAVTLEFLGPLTIALVASRRRSDLAWVGLAACGVVLLTKGGGPLDTTGVVFALLAAAGWATYIVASAATGRHFSGASGLALASAVGTVLIAPLGIADGGTTLLRPRLVLLAATVGVLSSLIPYTLEMRALRRVPKRIFGILMSLEPAVAALVGLVVLGQMLSWREWLAVLLVIGACVGVTLTGREAT